MTLKENGCIISIKIMYGGKILNASESTVRRDLGLLHEQGRLVRVHGGAIAGESRYTPKDVCVEERNEVNKEEKLVIGEFAASLIEDNDFIFTI